jgi:hypothetical protein
MRWAPRSYIYFALRSKCATKQPHHNSVRMPKPKIHAQRPVQNSKPHVGALVPPKGRRSLAARGQFAVSTLYDDNPTLHTLRIMARGQVELVPVLPSKPHDLSDMPWKAGAAFISVLGVIAAPPRPVADYAGQAPNQPSRPCLHAREQGLAIAKNSALRPQEGKRSLIGPRIIHRSVGVCVRTNPAGAGEGAEERRGAEG